MRRRREKNLANMLVISWRREFCQERGTRLLADYSFTDLSETQYPTDQSGAASLCTELPSSSCSQRIMTISREFMDLIEKT
jgi:hypothetical protein